MPTIAYDASRAALYTPERQETLFERGTLYTPTQWAVEASRLAYYRAEQSESEQKRLAAALSQAGFGEPRLFLDAATFAFGTIHGGDGTTLIAFRGTQPDEIRHIVTNLQAQQLDWHESGGRVHAGFAKATRGVLPQVIDWLAGEGQPRSRLILTGHSLGAALATLAASVLKPEMLITLGSPRVGDAEFVATLSHINVVRLVDGCDVVTQLPPALSFYAHAGAVTYITCIGGECIEDPAPTMIEADRVEGRARYSSEHAWKPGSVLLRELADHAPINYARGFF